ncbi:MAG: hypothetical protein MRY79_05495 [Alphaproteobacteria bacterium]|nr:hypothetical protein [Alphaproteobacteria bacterium]
MPLPSNHPWASQAPYNQNGVYLYALMGASNCIGSMLHDEALHPAQQQHHNTLFEKKVEHDDTQITFSTPVNKSNINTYSLLNEDGAYGYAGRLSARLREFTRKTVCAVSGGESATPMATGSGGWYSSRNSADPFDFTTRYGQMITRIQNAENTVGAKCQFIVTQMAGRDAAISVLASFWQSQYEAMVADIRSDLGNSSLKFVNVGLGPTPNNAATNYPTWEAIRSAQDNLENTSSVYNINPVTDLSYSLGTHVQGDEVHYNTLGYNGIADAIVNKLFPSV